MPAARPRHVLWITTDHLRYDCLGANGNPAIHTPNLDRLAAGGVVLDRCYAQNPLCMPSRVSFMTGQYPCRTGVTCNGPALPEDRGPTCAQVFAAAGYETAQIGKLHLEPHDEMDLDPAGRLRYGFDFMALSEEPGCYEDAYVRWLRSEHPEHERTMRMPRPRERMKSSAARRLLDGRRAGRGQPRGVRRLGDHRLSALRTSVVHPRGHLRPAPAAATRRPTSTRSTPTPTCRPRTGARGRTPTSRTRSAAC